MPDLTNLSKRRDRTKTANFVLKKSVYQIKTLTLEPC